MAILTDALQTEILQLAWSMEESGDLLTPEALRGCYDTFARRFGPQELRKLEGNELLEGLFDHSNRDSLVYWLEFKDDRELPNVFGSIAGGSALKFGIYRRRETGRWMTGSPAAQRELSVNEAVTIATRYRDQLLRGDEILSRLPDRADDQVYLKLQQDINSQLPELADLAWSHKYLTLLHPDRLDDYHSPAYQRHHLIRLLQRPPEGEGRYLCAGRYVAIAAELKLHLNTLTTVLNRRHGGLRSYWRVGTREGETFRFPEMKAGGWIGVGWSELGDLSDLSDSQAGKEMLSGRLAAVSHLRPSTRGRQTSQWFSFRHRPQENDIVLAADGLTVHGIGRITGGYRFEGGSGFAHRRAVEWVSLKTWKISSKEGLLTSFVPLSKVETLLAIEEHLSSNQRVEPPVNDVDPDEAPPPLAPLEGIAAQIQRALDRKGQIILHGPPGTGKTHWAEEVARELAARSRFGRSWGRLAAPQRAAITGDGADVANIQLCTFHPGFGYEDFIEGYRPTAGGSSLSFELRDGIFKRVCAEARRRPDEPFFLIIDEINRGDIPRIFGELITLLEKGRRGLRLRLAVSHEVFSVPPNVFVIGTMNTADRSIALLDTALRRRFAFLELMPDPALLGNAAPGGVPLGPWLAALNKRILAHVGRDARNLQIGHAYLMVRGQAITQMSELARALEQDLLPLLEEYCYEDYARLENILAAGLVDKEGQRIHRGLFEPSRSADLVQALLAMAPEITTSPQAIAADNAPDASEDTDSEGASTDPAP